MMDIIQLTGLEFTRSAARHGAELLEAGPKDASLWIPIPVGFYKLLTNKRYGGGMPMARIDLDTLSGVERED